MRLIETMDDIAAATESLGHVEPRFAALVAEAGLPPLRRAPSGFAGLAAIIVEQQISLHAAAAILKRLKQAVAPLTPEGLMAAGPEAMAAAGLSRAKIASLTALAEAVIAGHLDIDRLERLDDAGASAALCAIRGIGPWTADIYLLTCLGRPDVWPAGDVALQTAAGMVLELAERPGPRAMASLAEPWRPWRAVAARLLWAHYRRVKFRIVPETA